MVRRIKRMVKMTMVVSGEYGVGGGDEVLAFTLLSWNTRRKICRTISAVLRTIRRYFRNNVVPCFQEVPTWHSDNGRVCNRHLLIADPKSNCCIAVPDNWSETISD